jgi:hypothetical protein
MLALKASGPAYRCPFTVRSGITLVLTTAAITDLFGNRCSGRYPITPLIDSPSFEVVLGALMGGRTSHWRIIEIVQTVSCTAAVSEFP